MNMDNYKTGADFFRDIIVHHGRDEALVIGGRYLSAQLKTQRDDEKQFCRELFEVMQEWTTGKIDPEQMVYPYDFAKANERLESRYYHDSRTANNECAVIIDTAIRQSCYERNHYNLELAAMVAVHDYGFNRVNAVLAHNLQQHESDGRYSRGNKEWAQGFKLTEGAFDGAHMNAHPILLEDFTKHTRKLYDAVGAERFLLPGQPESGTVLHGYEVVRSITFDNQRGFAIGLNPNAANPFVCWQFTAAENGQRDFYWGNYANDLGGAADSYIARVMVHMKDAQVREVANPLAAAEMSAEQNYNMLDGRINNGGEKPSVMEQLREAKKAPPVPRKEQAADRDGPEL